MSERILNTAVNATGSNYQSLNARGSGLLAVQIYLAAAGSVSIEVRCADDLPWVPLKAYTTNAVEVIAALPYMRAVATGLTGRAIVEVQEI